MSRSMRYIFGVLLVALAMTLSGCGTPAPAGNVPTTVPTNTVAPATATLLPNPTVPPTDTALPPTIGPDSNPATPTGTLRASPVTGSVLVEGGNSMTGGASGATIELNVAFTASSAAGRVTEMRVDAGRSGGCVSEGEMASYDWEPFAAEKVYTTVAFINIQGWYVNVQYRDDQGNVSPVYCDDISVEGMPSAPTP